MEFHEESTESRKKRVLDFLKVHFQTNGDEIATKTLVNFTRESFFSPYFRNWKIAQRTKSRFLAKFGAWLQEEIKFPEVVLRCIPGPSSTSGGRPSKDFENVSVVVKRRKTQELRKDCSIAELGFATTMKLREGGDLAGAQLLDEMITTTPSRSKRILTHWRSAENEQSSYSLVEAVALLISANLTKEQYNTLRSGANKHGHDLYPPYYKVLERKKLFYPPQISISEKKCEVPLQNLLNITCESILKCISLEARDSSLLLLCKWGFDGSSGYTAYKQQSQHAPRADESIFTTSLVPLQLIEEKTKHIIWKNPRPASKRYCRPIRLQWVSETADISTQEEAAVKREIENLTPYGSAVGQINFKLCLTMVDGKVCSALTNTSSMTCYVCSAKISQMNDIVSLRQLPVNPNALQFGLSVLHAYIRCFECLLHISYRLQLQVWKVSKAHKEAFETRKRNIQSEFRQKMGLLVDIPKTGSGNTNDGNTARRFFSNPSLSAEITGIDEELIKRFGVILRTINSNYVINIDNFELYCLRTAEKYVSLYNWYYMPPSVHKLLIHGPIIVKEALLPIGELSEEAQESRNKDIRRYRQYHSRKISAEKIKEDLFHRLILTSDPLLSSFSVTQRPHRKLDDEMLQLVVINRHEQETLSGDEEQIDSSEEEFSDEESF